MYPINTANNTIPIKLADVFWIEDNQGCALHQCGKFRYSLMKVPIRGKKKGKDKEQGTEEVEVPKPFIANAGFFQCSSFRKARKKLTLMIAANPKLRIEWFHIKSGRVMVYPNNRRVQTSFDYTPRQSEQMCPVAARFRKQNERKAA